ncbi:MAG: hypothetical protein HAW63_02630 [Bdellovibrionaceae bacterium]|nr:hypothetical protein [Pseudobdellovibrionaceae bacterium]
MNVNRLNCELKIDTSSCNTVLPSNARNLSIRVSAPNPIVVNNQNLQLVGFCNEGAYPDNHITWEIKEANNSAAVLTSLETNGNALCENGKFRFTINIEKLQRNLATKSTQKYTLYYGIVGFDYTGTVGGSNQFNHDLSVTKN